MVSGPRVEYRLYGFARAMNGWQWTAGGPVQGFVGKLIMPLFAYLLVASGYVLIWRQTHCQLASRRFR